MKISRAGSSKLVGVVGCLGLLLTGCSTLSQQDVRDADAAVQASVTVNQFGFVLCKPDSTPTNCDVDRTIPVPLAKTFDAVPAMGGDTFSMQSYDFGCYTYEELGVSLGIDPTASLQLVWPGAIGQPGSAQLQANASVDLMSWIWTAPNQCRQPPVQPPMDCTLENICYDLSFTEPLLAMPSGPSPYTQTFTSAPRLVQKTGQVTIDTLLELPRYMEFEVNITATTVS